MQIRHNDDYLSIHNRRVIHTGVPRGFLIYLPTSAKRYGLCRLKKFTLPYGSRWMWHLASILCQAAHIFLTRMSFVGSQTISAGARGLGCATLTYRNAFTIESAHPNNELLSRFVFFYYYYDYFYYFISLLSRDNAEIVTRSDTCWTDRHTFYYNVMYVRQGWNNFLLTIRIHTLIRCRIAGQTSFLRRMVHSYCVRCGGGHKLTSLTFKTALIIHKLE